MSVQDGSAGTRGGVSRLRYAKDTVPLSADDDSEEPRRTPVMEGVGEMGG